MCIRDRNRIGKIETTGFVRSVEDKKSACRQQVCGCIEYLYKHKYTGRSHPISKSKSMNVKLFGALVDIAGTENLLLQSVSNANDLRNQFIELYPEAKTSKFLIAVNKKIVNENYSINESDEVALMPPFSGG
mgnify:CR=1 FL=1